MVSISVRNQDLYEAHQTEFELIGVFEKTLSLAIQKHAWSQSNTVGLVEDAVFELTPHLYSDFGEDNPYISIKVFVDDDVYLEHSDNIQASEREIERFISSVVPRLISIPLDVSLFPKSFLKKSNIQQWRSNPQYHFQEAQQTVSPEMLENIWGSASALHVFISHKAEKKDRAHNLKAGLAKYGISSFVAHDDIKPAEEWQEAIEKALFSSDALIALICDEFSESKWTDQEVGIAIGRQIPVFPVKLTHSANPYGFIGKIQAFKVKTSTLEDFVLRLLSDQRTSTISILSLLNAIRNSEDKPFQIDLLKHLGSASRVSWTQKATEELKKICKIKKHLKSSKELQDLNKFLNLETEQQTAEAPDLDSEIPF